MLKNKLIIIQWANSFGGLEKITSSYEDLFIDRSPLVLIFEYHKTGIKYKNYLLISKSKKISFFIKYFKFVLKNKEKIFHFQIRDITLLILTYFLGARKIVCQFHGCRATKKIHEKLLWIFLEKRIKIISNSLYSKNEIKTKYSVTKNISVIPNFINEKEFLYSKRTYNKGKFIVTYAGRLSRGKNLALLLETAKVIKQDYYDIEFRIYGDGPEKENLLFIIKELALENVVTIYPFNDNINQIYNESHLFIFLSLFETFGNVVAEAILTGLPVLCYKIPPLAEFITDDSLFFTKKNPNLIASRIIDIRNNYSNVNENLLNVHDHLKNHINNKKIFTEINNIYNQFEGPK